MEKEDEELVKEILMEWCNCQAIEGISNYPGPWHPKGDVTCRFYVKPIQVEEWVIGED